MWGKNEKILAENFAMKREIELLNQRILDKDQQLEYFKEQLKYTQEALVAKESPEAYRDRRMAEAGVPEEISGEEKDKRLKQAEIVSRYINEAEKDLFKDAEDMIAALMPVVGAPAPEVESLHGNAES